MSGAVPISIRNLTKQYGSTRAVNGLDLDAREGEILGFLGLNGAGKTTTIRILLDLLRPNSGEASIFGHDCQKDGLRARARVGYLPGEMGLYAHLTGREVLDLLAGLSGRGVEERRRREIQERLGFPDTDLRRRVREYSTGMKRKLGIIQAFQADPQLLILDEPTEGLDPLMQEAFYELLAEAKRRGKTVFMSSHVLSEVERVCDRIALMRRGDLVLLSTVDEIRRVAARRVRILFREDVATLPVNLAGAEVIEALPQEWVLSVQGPLGPLVQVMGDLPVHDLRIEEPRLEDVVMKYYRGGQK